MMKYLWNPQHQWVVDWSKVTTWQNLRELLQCMELTPNPHHPYFESIRHLCKMIDMDGHEVDPETLKRKDS